MRELNARTHTHIHNTQRFHWWANEKNANVGFIPHAKYNVGPITSCERVLFYFFPSIICCFKIQDTIARHIGIAPKDKPHQRQCEKPTWKSSDWLSGVKWNDNNNWFGAYTHALSETPRVHRERLTSVAASVSIPHSFVHMFYFSNILDRMRKLWDFLLLKFNSVEKKNRKWKEDQIN